MKLSRIFFLPPLFGLLFAAVIQTAFGQTLPAKVKSGLNKNHSGWKLHSGDSICKSRAVVAGDFDGNGKTDYAVMFKRARIGYIVAFLADRTDYKAVILESGAAGDMENSYLSVARKGQSYAGIADDDSSKGAARKLKTDAPVSGTCESSEYLYVYGNGKFKQVFTSD